MCTPRKSDLSLPAGSAEAHNWCLGNNTVFLNHGSFGACPDFVMRKRDHLLRRIESDPLEFMISAYHPLLASALERVTEFTGAEPGSVVFVENATTGINTIIRNLPLLPGDDVLVSDQEYFSSMNSLTVNASEKGVSVTKILLPFPVLSEDQVMDAVAAAVTSSTRFALIDHIVSATGMILPLKKIIDYLKNLGIGTIVDGAHGPGQVPLSLSDLGCMAYVGNCHKWLCSPRSCAVLYVNPEFQENFKPLVISHLPGEFDTGLSNYQIYFRWNGTPDPTPALCVPESIDCMSGLHSDGWSGIMKDNRRKALDARRVLCSALNTELPCPDSMVGSMAAIPLPGYVPDRSLSPDWIDPLQKWLKHSRGISVPVTGINEQTLLRISSQLYNSPEQYHYLSQSLTEYFSQN